MRVCMHMYVCTVCMYVSMNVCSVTRITYACLYAI